MFGKPTVRDALGTVLARPMTPFLMTGHYYDADVGIYIIRYRAYSPDLGRWLTREPIDFDGDDFNLYKYVMNNPVARIDPEGLSSLYDRCVEIYMQDVYGPVGGFLVDQSYITAATSVAGVAQAVVGEVIDRRVKSYGDRLMTHGYEPKSGYVRDTSQAARNSATIRGGRVQAGRLLARAGMGVLGAAATGFHAGAATMAHLACRDLKFD